MKLKINTIFYAISVICLLIIIYLVNENYELNADLNTLKQNFNKFESGDYEISQEIKLNQFKEDFYLNQLSISTAIIMTMIGVIATLGGLIGYTSFRDKISRYEKLQEQNQIELKKFIAEITEKTNKNQTQQESNAKILKNEIDSTSTAVTETSNLSYVAMEEIYDFKFNSIADRVENHLYAKNIGLALHGIISLINLAKKRENHLASYKLILQSIHSYGSTSEIFLHIQIVKGYIKTINTITYNLSSVSPIKYEGTDHDKLLKLLNIRNNEDWVKSLKIEKNAHFNGLIDDLLIAIDNTSCYVK